MFVKRKNGFFLSEYLRIILPLIPAILFIVGTIFLNTLEYNAYQYTQFDLGVGYRTLYNFHSTYILYNWPKPLIETPQTFSKLIYVPMSFTLYIYNSPLTLLIDQIVIIGIGGLSVFYISKKIVANSTISFVLELTYFLYPATYGFMTQGGNFMVFFEPFLLLSYYFYVRNNKFLTLLFITLGSVTETIAPLILIGFFILLYFDRLIVLVSNRYKSNKNGLHSYDLIITKRKIFDFFYFLIPTVILLMSIKLYGIGNIYSDARLGNLSSYLTSTNGTIIQAIGSNFSSKLSFLNAVLEPLLYIPLLSIYSLPVWFYFLVAFYSNQPIYYDILTRQYSYLFAGFLFISLINVFKNASIHKRIFKKIIIVLLISSLVSFAIYSPFSIGNIQNGELHVETTPTPLEHNLTNAFSLIPKNASVLVQNNIVQLDNRKEVYFPNYYNGQLVQYAIFAPPTTEGIVGKAAFSHFSEKLENEFANNDSFGLYVRLGNIEIYKLHFTGNPVIFSKEIFSGNEGFVKTSNASNTIVTTSSIQLAPGPYNTSFSFTLGSISKLNLSQFNLNVNLSIMSMNSSISKGTIREVVVSGNKLTFSGYFMVRNFGSYSVVLNLSTPNSNNYSLVGASSYCISSIPFI
jgi:uncharacterized membrane protein